MKTSNSVSLKAEIKKKASELNLLPQFVMQNYVLECFLNRISKSQFKDNFILKGGFLLTSLLGLESRSTMDMDTTVKNFTLTQKEITNAIKIICDIEVDDDFQFKFDRIEDIRESDDYPGLRAYLFADYEKIHAPFSVDFTTGDKITPKPVDFFFTRLFDDCPIMIKSYPVETILAEKLETILSRNIANTRPRDFYDVYMLEPKILQCSPDTLRKALDDTVKKRESEKYLAQHKILVEQIQNDVTMNSIWIKYSKKMPYASDISFQTVCAAVKEVLDFIYEAPKNISS